MDGAVEVKDASGGKWPDVGRPPFEIQGMNDRRPWLRFGMWETARRPGPILNDVFNRIVIYQQE